MLKALHDREITDKPKYLLLCETCKISITNKKPVMCHDCGKLIWCGKCPQYNDALIDDDDLKDEWVCRKCLIFVLSSEYNE